MSKLVYVSTNEHSVYIVAGIAFDPNIILMAANFVGQIIEGTRFVKSVRFDRYNCVWKYT